MCKQVLLKNKSVKNKVILLLMFSFVIELWGKHCHFCPNMLPVLLKLKATHLTWNLLTSKSILPVATNSRGNWAILNQCLKCFAQKYSFSTGNIKLLFIFFFTKNESRHFTYYKKHKSNKIKQKQQQQNHHKVANPRTCDSRCSLELTVLQKWGFWQEGFKKSKL